METVPFGMVRSSSILSLNVPQSPEVDNEQINQCTTKVLKLIMNKFHKVLKLIMNKSTNVPQSPEVNSLKKNYTINFTPMNLGHTWVFSLLSVRSVLKPNYQSGKITNKSFKSHSENEATFTPPGHLL
jgi:hypothetical protein